MRDKIREIMSRLFRISAGDIDESASMDTIESWDSLEHISLILALEETFDVRFFTEEVVHMTSYTDIVAALERHVGQPR